MSNNHRLRIPDYLEHILEALERIKKYTENIDEYGFLHNMQVQDAVIRNIEIIGEASRNIDCNFPEFSELYQDFPLKIAYEMRNVLAHGYFKVDLKIVWKTVEKDLPKLQKQVQKILVKYKNRQI